MDIGFGEAVLLFGGLLAVAAALSGVMRGTVLSISVLSVALGIGLAATDVVSVDAQDQAVVNLVELALILTLFSDGMYVERELLAKHWGPVARAIVLAMPITLGLLALAAKGLFPALDWAEAFLLAAVLTPTDPVVTSSVVTAQRVPESVSHTLNLESGLNDGLALPFVLFFIVLAAPGGDAGGEAGQLLGEAAFGAVIGVAVGLLGGRLRHHLPGGGLTARYEGIYALGFGLAAFGLADVTFGNGLIAAFVAGIAMGAAEREVPDSFIVFSENISAIAQVLTIFVFGALIVATGYEGDVWRLLLFVPFALLVARPAAVMLSYLRERLPRPHKLFIAWFGPKGVASMLFALFVLNSNVGNRSLIFDIAAFTILASIAAHGLTDTVGARWFERRVSEALLDPIGGCDVLAHPELLGLEAERQPNQLRQVEDGQAEIAVDDLRRLGLLHVEVQVAEWARGHQAVRSGVQGVAEVGAGLAQ
jgi:NhaP-type Na+/H+ or K+/H+ antiporter